MRGLFLFALAVGIAPSAGLADPPEAVPVRELDGLAVAVLKEMHNRGAELYNA